MKAQLQKAEAYFADRKVNEAMEILGGLIEAAEGNAPARDQLLAWVIARVADDHPQIGAHIALMGGALVENGASPAALGRAIVAPVLRALTDAARMFELAKAHGHEHGEHDEDDGHGHGYDDDDHDDHDEAGHDAHGEGGGHDHGEHEHAGHGHDHDDSGHEHEHTLEVGGWALSEDELGEVAKQDVAAVRAWFSLEMWYRPAVACWSRDRAVLREVQGHAELRAAIARIGRDTDTSYWLSILAETLLAAPVVVLVPELGEAWRMTVDGVVDMGQLTVLASKVLADPIARVGGSGIATDEELAVMTGEGEQSGGGGYGSSFAFYTVEACDPDDGLPRDNVHLWTAPGGTGMHSLPGDFLPGTLAPIDGARVLVMVGPNAPGSRFVRVIQSSRMFEALSAKITDVQRVPGPDAAALLAHARDRGRAART